MRVDTEIDDEVVQGYGAWGVGSPRGPGQLEAVFIDTSTWDGMWTDIMALAKKYDYARLRIGAAVLWFDK
jgi:hypothetical protein